MLKRLDDEQAQDIIFIDLKGKSAVADGLVIAQGTVGVSIRAAR